MGRERERGEKEKEKRKGRKREGEREVEEEREEKEATKRRKRNECSVAHRPPAAPALPAAAIRAAVHLFSKAAMSAQRVSELEEPRQLLFNLSPSLPPKSETIEREKTKK